MILDDLVPNQNNFESCQYFSINDFNNLSLSIKHNFLIIHINIRSFNKNSDEFFAFISQCNRTPDIIVMTETWFSPENFKTIPNYQSFHTYRSTRRGGGVTIYIKSCYRAIKDETLSYANDIFEMCTVCVHLEGNERVRLHGIYRPPIPENVTPFVAALENNILCSPKVKYILAGDFNVNLGDPSNNDMEYINLCYQKNLSPCITVPTHVSGSIIDNLWTNIPCTVPGVFPVSVSDHYPFFVYFMFNKNNGDTVKKYFRDHSAESIKTLENDVACFLSTFHLLNLDISSKVSIFNTEIFSLYNKNCPIKVKTMSFDRYRKPWIREVHMKCINRKHELFRKYKRGEANYNEYNIYKNVVGRILKIAKNSYYKNKFTQNVGNARETWRTINSLINPNNSNQISEVILNGNAISKSADMARAFNEYFSGIALELDRTIPPSNISPLTYMPSRCLHSMFLSPSNAIEVKSIISGLKNKGGFANSLPTFIYKILSNVLCPTISCMFNQSISHGLFPDCLKVAQVIPIHKKGAKNKIENYRPISLLHILSKIFERMMYNRVLSFLARNNVLCMQQFGFRKNLNTTDAILEFTNNIYNSLNKSEYFMAIFLDFTKAFDTVDHSILITKLDYSGIRGVAGEWFRSYLYNRKQYVSINYNNSSTLNIIKGVPQGSVLAPLLFLIYINDLHRTSNVLKFVHFADDTTVFHSHSDLNVLTTLVNAELYNISNWLIANRLSLNVNKSSYMIISNKKIIQCPVLCIDNEVISRVESTKFLGITIDDKLKFNIHVTNITKQSSIAIGKLYQISSYVPIDIKLSVYFALIYSRVSYGILAYGRSNMSNMHRMSNLMKRCNKAICYPFRERNETNKLLNFQSLYTHSACIKLYKVLNCDQHDYFLNVCRDIAPEHNHNTRYAACNNFNIPFYYLSQCQKSFIFQVIGEWNNIPVGIRSIGSLTQFKHKLKNYLLELQS